MNQKTNAADMTELYTWDIYNSLKTIRHINKLTKVAKLKSISKSPPFSYSLSMTNFKGWILTSLHVYIDVLTTNTSKWRSSFGAS